MKWRSENIDICVNMSDIFPTCNHFSWSQPSVQTRRLSFPSFSFPSLLPLWEERSLSSQRKNQHQEGRGKKEGKCNSLKRWICIFSLTLSPRKKMFSLSEWLLSLPSIIAPTSFYNQFFPLAILLPTFCNPFSLTISSILQSNPFHQLDRNVVYVRVNVMNICKC